MEHLLSGVTIIGNRSQFAPGRNSDPGATRLPVAPCQHMWSVIPEVQWTSRAAPVFIPVSHQHQVIARVAIYGKGYQAHTALL